MKAAFLFVSTLCAAALSLLVMVLATGRIPLRGVPEKPSATAAAAPEKPEAPIIELPGEDAVTQLMSAARRDRDACEARAKALDAREQELAAQKAMIEKLNAELRQLKDEARKIIVSIAADETVSLRQLAEVYARMEPDSAAKVLVEMEKERAAKLISLINERRAAAIMDAAVAAGDKGRAMAVEWSDILHRLKKETEHTRRKGA
jgi:flagellar motility protein MotE (MotC chaperone)